MATVGMAMALRRAISPGWFMPSSITAACCAASMRNSVSGTPISLFRLPRVARRPSSPWAAARIEAIISLTVVLPLLPVTPMTGMRELAAPVVGDLAQRDQRIRHDDGRQRPAGRQFFDHDGGDALLPPPAAGSCGRRTLRRAARRTGAPAATLRLSVDTPSNATSPARVVPAPRRPASDRICASTARINSSSSWSGAPTARAARGRCRKTAASCP